jgi:hypothetical protein
MGDENLKDQAGKSLILEAHEEGENICGRSNPMRAETFATPDLMNNNKTKQRLLY